MQHYLPYSIYTYIILYAGAGLAIHCMICYLYIIPLTHYLSFEMIFYHFFYYAHSLKFWMNTLYVKAVAASLTTTLMNALPHSAFMICNHC